MSFFPATHNVTVYAGDTVNFAVTYLEGPESAEVGVDLTGATFVASIAPNVGDTPVTAFDVTADPDQVTNPGLMNVTLTAANSDLLTGNVYVWDLEITWPDTEVQTIIKGVVSVTQDVS